MSGYYLGRIRATRNRRGGQTVNVSTLYRKSPPMPKERILVVDDEEDLLELVKYNLTKEGYRVATVSSGEEAIRRARNDLPDLMVLDLLLPSVDGLEVCRVLKNDVRTKHIPIVMLTAKGEEADMVTGLE